jgi:hypothetical protein
LRIHTSRFDKRGVVLGGENGIREVTEELLEQASDTVDIVEECFGVAEVNL